MNIRPLHDRVLVKRLAAEDKTSGGLFIPDTAKEKPLEALEKVGKEGVVATEEAKSTETTFPRIVTLFKFLKGITPDGNQ